MSENPPKETRHCHRYKQRNGKSEGTCLHAVDEVHTVGNIIRMDTEVSVRITVFMLLLMMLE